MRLVDLFRGALLIVLALVAAEATHVRADLSRKQARKLITRVAGFDLPNKTVRVTRVSGSNAAAEATAEVLVTFRLSTDERGVWRVFDLRSAPNNWESMALLSESAVVENASIDCDAPDLANNDTGSIEPTVKRARCLIAALLGVHLPSDSVRIKNVDPFVLPLASNPSVVVEALITLEFRFERERRKGWEVTDLRSGTRDWISIETITAIANEEKLRRALADLSAMAQALEKLRKERSSYVVSDSHAVLIDHLSPRYLVRVIRVDPWHRPYQYRGTSQTYTLQSVGPDGKESTPDDLVVNGPR